MAAIPPTVDYVLLLSVFISLCIADDVATYNAALNRPSYQSSVWSDEYGKYFAYFANDGDLETNIQVDGVPKCAVTQEDTYPWWAVDLGRPLKVYKIYFTNRKYSAGRARNFIIGLTNVSPLTSPPVLRRYAICGQYQGDVPASATVPLYCADNLPPFRYVIVQLPTKTFLNFCELQVHVKASRLDNFVVGLTNKNPAKKANTPVYKYSYTLCAQYNGSVADHEDAVVVCEPTNQTFRYVIVHGSNVPDRSLCLAEVSVYDRGDNLALNRPSYQISTGDGNKTASQANDGRTDTESCTRDMQEHPWWAVNLGKAYNVGRVIISNVNFESGLDNFLIGLTNDHPSKIPPIYKCQYTICGQFSGSVKAGEDVNVMCAPTSQTFQYVIVHAYSMKSKALCLAEVSVFAGPGSMDPNATASKTPGNLALNRDAEQRSTMRRLEAGLAVDGNLLTQSCTADQVRGVHPWWTVDLGAAHDIGHVVISSGDLEVAGGRKRQKSHATGRLHSLNRSLLIIITTFSLYARLLL